MNNRGQLGFRLANRETWEYDRIKRTFVPANMLNEGISYELNNLRFNWLLNKGLDVFGGELRETIAAFLIRKKFKEYFVGEIVRQLYPDISEHQAYIVYHRFVKNGLNGVDNTKFMKKAFFRPTQPFKNNVRSRIIMWRNKPKKITWKGQELFELKDAHLNFRQGIKNIVENFFNQSDV